MRREKEGGKKEGRGREGESSRPEKRIEWRGGGMEKGGKKDSGKIKSTE